MADDESASGGVDGTWMRGSDGGLYFIPDAELEAFRIPDEIAGPTMAEVDEMEVDAHGMSFAGGGAPEGAQAAGFNVNWQPIAAIRGPLADINIAASPAIIPPPESLRFLRWEQQTPGY
jgi:hypothetical protein